MSDSDLHEFHSSSSMPAPQAAPPPAPKMGGANAEKESAAVSLCFIYVNQKTRVLPVCVLPVCFLSSHQAKRVAILNCWEGKQGSKRVSVERTFPLLATV